MQMTPYNDTLEGFASVNVHRIEYTGLKVQELQAGHTRSLDTGGTTSEYCCSLRLSLALS